uniref:Uncharacterized protein n=1 Tax=Arundo donax TaxID=35708 RepID=A0A0A8YR47_ARUDO
MSRASLCTFSFITPKPPSLFGRYTIFQAAKGGFVEFTSDPLHKQCFLYLSICLITVLGSSIVLM